MQASKKGYLHKTPANAHSLSAPPRVFVEFFGCPFDKLYLTHNFVKTIHTTDYPPPLTRPADACPFTVA